MSTISITDPELRVLHAALSEAGYPHLGVGRYDDGQAYIEWRFRDGPPAPDLVKWRAWFLTGYRSCCWECFKIGPVTPPCDHPVVWV